MDDKTKQAAVAAPENPFSNPAINSGDTNAAASGAYGQSISQIGGNTQRANEATKGLMDEQINTPGNKLNKQGQNANNAKGGGMYGMFNNRNYGTTLKLARQADAYNSRPIEGVPISQSTAKGATVVGQRQKPQLNTMEQRAMEQTQQLDTNQKQLAQALQAAVFAKDLDAFKSAYAQLYQVNLTDLAARNMMASMLYQQRLSNFYAKDLQRFMPMFNQWNVGQQLSALYQLSQINNPFASAFMTRLGYTPWQEDQIYSDRRLRQIIGELQNKYPNSNYYDLYNAAMDQFNAEGNDYHRKVEDIYSKGAGKKYFDKKVKPAEEKK